MPRVSTDAYLEWQWKYYPNQKNQRFGQGFINHFYDDLREFMPDPNLFYDTNEESCKVKIKERYIEDESD